MSACDAFARRINEVLNEVLFALLEFPTLVDDS